MQIYFDFQSYLKYLKDFALEVRKNKILNFLFKFLDTHTLGKAAYDVLILEIRRH